jgi:hypothetical protein
MPRASWRGFLRLSLVSCPVYLSPATTRTKPIRVWQPAPVDVDEDDLPDRGGGRQGSAPSVPRLPADNASADGDESPAATRITLRPHDPGTGEELNRSRIVLIAMCCHHRCELHVRLRGWCRSVGRPHRALYRSRPAPPARCGVVRRKHLPRQPRGTWLCSAGSLSAGCSGRSCRRVRSTATSPVS